MTPKDVLSRALLILDRGPIAEPCNNGPDCPFCAIAVAKTELDTEHGTGLAFRQCLTNTQYLTDNLKYCGELVESDFPLVEARELVTKAIGGKAVGEITGREAIEQAHALA